jgi:ribosome-associated heat shock protein Hsp15
MRIDKFLNAVNIAKSRTIGTDMINSKVVEINGVICKASKEVSVGDTVTVNYLQESKRYKVLAIPTTKTTPKSKQAEYIELLG